MMKTLSILIITLLLQQPVWNSAKNGLLIDGYDVVSYFEGSAQKGTSRFQSTYNGAIFYFSSEKHKTAFDENPEKYVPEYGGYCAYAMGATAEKVSINPKTYKITDGKLYLFYNSLGTNTLTLWEEDEVTLHQKADENWKSKYDN